MISRNQKSFQPLNLMLNIISSGIACAAVVKDQVNSRWIEVLLNHRTYFFFFFSISMSSIPQELGSRVFFWFKLVYFTLFIFLLLMHALCFTV